METETETRAGERRVDPLACPAFRLIPGGQGQVRADVAATDGGVQRGATDLASPRRRRWVAVPSRRAEASPVGRTLRRMLEGSRTVASTRTMAITSRRVCGWMAPCLCGGGGRSELRQ